MYPYSEEICDSDFSSLRISSTILVLKSAEYFLRTDICVLRPPVFVSKSLGPLYYCQHDSYYPAGYGNKGLLAG